jgi:hypothetical protein
LKLINNNNDNTSSNVRKSHSFSFFVWFFVAILITALGFNVFAVLWIGHLKSIFNLKKKEKKNVKLL